MSYSMPQWDIEDIKPLLECLGEAFIKADRYDDALLKHYLKLLLNLAYARLPFIGDE